MSSVPQRNIIAHTAGAAISKGMAVKLSSGKVIKCAGTTDRAIGLAQTAPTADGDMVEVALPGGGGFGLAEAAISAGNLLGVNASGKLQKVASASDIIIAQALEDAAAGDVFAVMVIGPSQATATQS